MMKKHAVEKFGKKFAAAMGLLGLLGLSQGCEVFQTYNSLAGDESLYGDTTGGTADFRAARTVIRAECARCHTKFLSYTEQQWIDENYVTRGLPDASLIYSKIRGSNVGGEENMPPSAPISSDDLAKIRTWIEGL